MASEQISEHMNQCPRQNASLCLYIHKGHGKVEEHDRRNTHGRIKPRGTQQIILRLSGREVPRKMPDSPDKSQQ